MPKLWVNDLDLAALYGLWLDTPDGWPDAPEQRDSPVTIPGTAGALLALDEATIAPRTITVTGHIIGASATAIQSAWDGVKSVLAAPLLELRSEAYPDRFILARYQRARWLRRESIADAAGIALDFLAPNPYSFGAQIEVVHIPNGGRPRALTLGTAPSPVKIIISNPASAVNPAVLYLDAQGRQRGKLGFTYTLTVGHWIEADGATGLARVVSSAGTVIADASPLLAADSLPFDLDPLDGDGTQGPALVGLNAEGVAHVRRAYR